MAAPQFSGWYVSDVRQGVRSIFDQGRITVGVDPVEPLEVHLSPGGGTIKGILQEGNAPARGDYAKLLIALVPQSQFQRDNLMLDASKSRLIDIAASARFADSQICEPPGSFSWAGDHRCRPKSFGLECFILRFTGTSIMLLTITTTHRPATDIGYLLGKNPTRTQSFPVSFGQVHVFYPFAEEDRCTAVLLLDIDPVSLVRGRRGSSGDSGLLAQYVNDRPYVASSFLSVAIASVYGSAMKGYSKERAELAETPIPLSAEIPAVPCRGGELFLRRLFEPLGYSVECRRLPLDDRFLEWGESPYLSVAISSQCRLKDLLTHLYVLLPVLDNDKHYWVGPDEIQKLLDRGTGWLEKHPERDHIVSRYLKRRGYLVREALARLVADEEVEPDATEERRGQEEENLEATLSLNEQRTGAVLSVLRNAGARSVLDLGCGEGRLLQSLLKDKTFQRIVGVDVSHRALEIARNRLGVESLPEKPRDRIEFFQGALTYRDKRFEGFEAACAVEVIEHLELSRLPAFERVVFEFARPATVVITTPNVEYNSVFKELPAGRFRHNDHRFEWTRSQFQRWARNVGERFGYSVRFLGIGEEASDLGAPTQMGVFSR